MSLWHQPLLGGGSVAVRWHVCPCEDGAGGRKEVTGGDMGVDSTCVLDRAWLQTTSRG